MRVGIDGARRTNTRRNRVGATPRVMRLNA